MWDDLSEEWVQQRRCMANVSSSSLSEVSRLVGLRPEAVHLPIWHQPEWWARGNVTNDQMVTIQWQVKRAIDCHWKFFLKRDLPAIKARAPLYHPTSLLLKPSCPLPLEGAPVLSQCHLVMYCKHLSPPYLYFMLLPFRPWAACCKPRGAWFPPAWAFSQGRIKS